jgi:ubiquinone/menaquinone biosynthesis C-methylase UbiE
VENIDSKKRKEKHNKLTKDFFKECANEKMGYYDAKKKVKLDHSSKQYKIWNLCTSCIDKLINNNKNIKKVIDVGCGIGDFTIDLSKRYPFLEKIVGIDFIDEAVDIASKNAKDSDKISFFKKDLLNLNYDDRSFDLSICINVFHHIHVEDFEKAVEEISRITDKYVILEIRNKKNIFNFYYKYIALPFYYNNLPVATCSISEVNKMFKKQNFNLLNAKGIYSRIWICRRLILIYKREENN